MDGGWQLSFPHWRGCKTLVKYCFWTTGKYRMRSVIRVLLRWISNFFLSSMELCRTVVRKSSINKGLYICSGGTWHPKLWQKLAICSACYCNLEGLKFCLGGFARKRPLVATGMKRCSGTKMFFDEWQTVSGMQRDERRPQAPRQGGIQRVKLQKLNAVTRRFFPF